MKYYFSTSLWWTIFWNIFLFSIRNFTNIFLFISMNLEQIHDLFFMKKMFGQLSHLFVPTIRLSGLQFLYFFFDVISMTIGIFERLFLQFSFRRISFWQQLTFCSRFFSIAQMMFGPNSFAKIFQKWSLWKAKKKILVNHSLNTNCNCFVCTHWHPILVDCTCPFRRI